MTTKEELLKSAADVVAASGSRALTLEAVAVQAGVSKGGLLYHFPTKSALIAAMVGQAVAAFEASVQAAVDGGKDWLGAYVEASLADVGTLGEGAGPNLAGVITAVAEGPALVAPFREALNRWYGQALEGYGTPVLPLLLALDGLWFHSQIGTLPAVVLADVADSLRQLAGTVPKIVTAAAGEPS